MKRRDITARRPATSAQSRTGSSAFEQPNKIRRALTFNGSDAPAVDNVLHPPIQDPFAVPETSTIPSFIEQVKDSLRRITPSTVSLF